MKAERLHLRHTAKAIPEVMLNWSTPLREFDQICMKAARPGGDSPSAPLGASTERNSCSTATAMPPGEMREV
jgi:hypothetical protein